MAEQSDGSPQTMTTGMVVAFYGATALVALAWSAFTDAGAAHLWRAPAAIDGQPWWLAGLVAGTALLALSWLAEAVSPAMRTLTAELAAALGPIATGRAIGWALASGVAEEALFRGPLQDLVGWPIAALLFAAMHGGTSRRLIAWSTFALCAGAFFGLLADRYDSLWPAVLAHVLVNGVNLRRLGARAAAAQEATD
jgi:membrane protease YdiL (CAAX protease family)